MTKYTSGGDKVVLQDMPDRPHSLLCPSDVRSDIAAYSAKTNNNKEFDLCLQCRPSQISHCLWQMTKLNQDNKTYASVVVVFGQEVKNAKQIDIILRPALVML